MHPAKCPLVVSMISTHRCEYHPLHEISRPQEETSNGSLIQLVKRVFIVETVVPR
jgi:hypothetical protein